MIRLLPIISILAVSSVMASNEGWRIKSISEELGNELGYPLPISSEIEFFNGHIAKTDIIEFQYIDLFTSDEGIVFIMFKGRICSQCDVRTSLYMNPVNQKVFSGENRYLPPGKLFDVYSEDLIQESRMFYGKCLDGGTKTIIWFSTYLGEDGNWHKVVYDLDFDGNEILESPNTFDYSLLTQAEDYVSKGLCREEQPVETTTMP